MKQTAISYLIEKLELKVMAKHIPWVQKTLDDALEMQKEQNESICVNVIEIILDKLENGQEINSKEIFEKFYNETFNL